MYNKADRYPDNIPEDVNQEELIHTNNKIEEVERRIQELKERKESTTDQAELTEIEEILQFLDEKLTSFKQARSDMLGYFADINKLE